jgi:hypothetical protein
LSKSYDVDGPRSAATAKAVTKAIENRTEVVSVADPVGDKITQVAAPVDPVS